MSEADEIYKEYKDYVEKNNKEILEMVLHLQIRHGIDINGKEYHTNIVEMEIKNIEKEWYLIHLDDKKIDIDKLLDIIKEEEEQNEIK